MKKPGFPVAECFIFILPLFVARSLALLSNARSIAISENIPDILRGFMSDVAVGILTGIFLFLVSKNRKLSYGVLIIWSFLFALNLEHIRTLNANANFAFYKLAVSEEFMRGSLLSLRSAKTVLTCSLIITACFFISRIRWLKTISLGNLSWLLPLTSIFFLMPYSHGMPYWIQMNLLEENARNVLTGEGQYFLPTESDGRLARKFFEKDLDGDLIVDRPLQRPNVIIIILESIGYNAGTSASMPRLKGLHKDAMSYSSFISMQQQTNRGLYSIMCGDYPNLVSFETKADFAGVYGTSRTCLPSLLREEGYRTVFMQGAPLGYMRKDRFLTKAGVTELYGSDEYDSATVNERSAWGVDDKSLYSNALLKIRELKSGGVPWFLGLLTVSTHHPFTVPGKISATAAEAASFSDDALGDFISSLREMDVFKDTLILITCDETRLNDLSDREFSSVQNLINNNHGTLLVFAPGCNRTGELSGVFTQADIELSIADYLDMPTKGLFGRSIFRSYQKERNILFSNISSLMLFGLSSDRRLYICSRDIKCSSFTYSGSPFGSQVYSAQPDPGYISSISEALKVNELTSDRLLSEFLYVEKDNSYRGSRALLDEHRIKGDKGDTFTWSVIVESPEDLQLSLDVFVALKGMGGGYIRLFNQSSSICRNGRCEIRRSHTIKENDTWLSTHLTVTAPKGMQYLAKEVSIRRERDLAAAGFN